MDIINHFKKQADKAMVFLREQGVVTEDDVRGGLQEEQQ